MKDEQQEKLFRAIGEVGGDLVDMAEKRTFAPSPWRKWGTMAACLAVVLSLTMLALPYFPAGCGSSGANETATPTAQPEAAVDSAAGEPNLGLEDALNAPAEPEETAPETPASEGQKEGLVNAQLRSRVVFRHTYYYVLPASFVAHPELPEYLGDALETVAEAEDASLVGCQVYRVEGAREFDNHSVDGLSVPEEIWIETDEGFFYAITLNEKTVARYTLEDAVQAVLEGDDHWLLEIFVMPVYNMDSFADASELTGDQLNQMLMLTRSMNTGIAPDNLWTEMTEDGGVRYVIPVTEAVWRLSRILEGYLYTPEETEAYDAQQGALVFDPTQLNDESNGLSLKLEGTNLEYNVIELTVGYYFDEKAQETPYLIRTFTIRFDEDAWRYLSILDQARTDSFETEDVT